jgi:hypothetical protein
MDVALYTEPGPVWERLARSQLAHQGDVQIHAIISPHHGDNDADMAGDNIPLYLAHNQTWLDGMAMLRKSGVRVQHYLHLRNLTCSERTAPGTCVGGGDCCRVPDGSIQPKIRCCNSLENVTAILDAALKYFPEDGIFQDNGPFHEPAADSEIRTLDQVREFEVAVYNLTQRGGPREVSGNGFDYDVHDPAVGHGDWALAMLNETMLHETTIPFVPPLPKGWPASRFTVLVGGADNATAMRYWVDRFLDAGWGGMCVLDTATVDCGYCTLPEFWEEEVAYLANKSRARRRLHGQRDTEGRAQTAIAGGVEAMMDGDGGMVPGRWIGDIVVTASCPITMADCTEALSAALNHPDAHTVVVPASPRRVWPVLPIEMVSDSSNRTIIFEPGVIVQAIRGAFKGGGDSLITATGVDNVAIEGVGARFEMWRSDYRNISLYNHSESRMGLQLLGVRNLSVTGLEIADTGGDGIYLAGEGHHIVLPNGTRIFVSVRNESENVVIDKVHCRDNYRQGLSIISAKNLTVTNSVFSGTNGTAPM